MSLEVGEVSPAWEGSLSTNAMGKYRVDVGADCRGSRVEARRSGSQACYNSTLMETQPPGIPVEAPPRPRKALTRQVWLQVYLPVGLSVIVVAAAVAVLWRAQVGDASAWADVALVILIVPAFVLGLVMLLALGGLVYVLTLVIRGVPGPARQGVALLRRVDSQTRRGAGVVARPFIVVPAFWAAVAAMLRTIGSIFSKK